MNKVIMMGRIASDLELKTTPNGIAVCTFRLAVDRNYQKKGEEQSTNFFNVAAWRGTAEFITKWFAKGRMILVEGEMQTRQYNDKNGTPTTWYEVVVDQAHFTGEKSTESNEKPEGGSTHAQTQNAQYGANNTLSVDAAATNAFSADIDDYPF